VELERLLRSAVRTFQEWKTVAGKEIHRGEPGGLVWGSRVYWLFQKENYCEDGDEVL